MRTDATTPNIVGPTMLGVVACVGSGVQTDATTRNIVGPTMLGVVESVARSLTFDRFQTLHNNSQQQATTCNRVSKRKEYVTSNNVGSCSPTMLRPFARGLKLPNFCEQKTTRSFRVKYCLFYSNVVSTDDRKSIENIL